MAKPLILIATVLAVGCIEPHVEVRPPDPPATSVQSSGGILFDEGVEPADDVAALEPAAPAVRPPHQALAPALPPMAGAAAPEPVLEPVQDAGSAPEADTAPAVTLCTLVEVSAAGCAGTCLGICIDGPCSRVENDLCAGTCEGQCMGQCEMCEPAPPDCRHVPTPSEVCDGTCLGTCSGDCSALDASGACAGKCEGLCMGTCRVCQ